MRALDRLISFIFSIIMLIVSIVLILVGVGVVEPQMITDMLNQHIFVKDMINLNVFNALTIAGIVLFLASLKTTVFLSLFKIKDKSPILVKTQNGEVEIAQETITSTVRNVAVSFENIKDIQAKMLKKKKGVVIYAMVLVYANTNIRETIEELQKQVKEVIKATTGVHVIEVNIKVKNIYQKQKKSELNNEEKNVSKLNLEENKVEVITNTSEVNVNEVLEQDLNEVETSDENNEDLEQIVINEVSNEDETK